MLPREQRYIMDILASKAPEGCLESVSATSSEQEM